MRKIGSINKSDEQAKEIHNIMAGANIDVQAEEEGDQIEFWALEDDQLHEAKNIFQQAKSGSFDDLKELAERGKSVQKEKKVAHFKQEINVKKHRLVHSGQSTQVTKFLIVASIALFALASLRPNIGGTVFVALQLWDFRTPAWENLLDGQLWRLITPILLHFSILHIFFNLWWMLDLGRMVESRLGSLKYAGLLLFIAIPSHLAQGYFFGPTFGGLSGVVYGLLGYIWLRSKRDPRCGLQLHPQTMMIMMIFLVLGFTVFKNIANGVHVVGLLMGLLAAQWKTRS
jgi:GlpG protein